MNNGLGKAIKIISKIVEIASWIGSGITAVLILALIFTRDLGVMKYFTDVNQETANASISGFSINFADSDGTPLFGAFMIFFITALIMMILTALAFRNVNLVFKTAEGSTPFQPAIVKMIKKIGYYIIAMPVIGTIMSVIGELVMHTGNLQINVDFTYIFVGLIVLALSQFFAYGVSLEDDVDGLV